MIEFIAHLYIYRLYNWYKTESFLFILKITLKNNKAKISRNPVSQKENDIAHAAIGAGHKNIYAKQNDQNILNKYLHRIVWHGPEDEQVEQRRHYDGQRAACHGAHQRYEQIYFGYANGQQEREYDHTWAEHILDEEQDSGRRLVDLAAVYVAPFRGY